MQQEVFDGEKLSRLMEKLPKGKPRIDAYEEAIRLADQAQDAYWRLGFRFHYAREVYFQDDPPKCIGAAAEFGPIFEAASPKLQKDPVMLSMKRFWSSTTSSPDAMALAGAPIFGR